jgi:hypothetical protein
MADKENSLLDFANTGHYNRSILALQWLTRLLYDFRKARHKVSSLELFLKSIKMLLKGELARRLDSTLRIRKLINN